MSSKKSTEGQQQQEAQAVLQLLQAQGAMQGLLMAGYSWAFDSCTAAGSGPQLSQKEKRCIAQGIATFVDARSHIAQSMAQHAAAAAKDM